MEYEETYNEVNDSEVGYEAQQDTGEVGTSEVTESTETVEEVATPQTQTPDVNAQFAAARRAAEAESRQIKAQNDRLLESLKAYGYEGDPDTIADSLLAAAQGITQEEAQAQRMAQETANAEKTRLQSELDTYKAIAIEKLMADDLKTINSVYPEVKDLKELGDEFFSLLAATKDPLLSYEAVQAKKAKLTKPTPPETGAVNIAANKEKDFYTQAEVDKLTREDYKRNPKLWDVVYKSMTSGKW